MVTSRLIEPAAILRPRRRRWPYLLPLPAAFYVAYMTSMYFGQELVIFPGTVRPHFAAPGPIEPDVEQIWLTADDGVCVEAWYKIGDGCAAQTPGPALFYFHANYDLVDTGWWVARPACSAGVSTLVMEYRGYGRVAGRPSQTVIVADAVRFYDWLVARPEVDRHRIAFQGTSLGGAVATAVAAQRRPAALVLECTFSSMAALAHRYGLPGSLCRHPFESDRVLPTLHIPIAIFHGRNDCTIPVEHGRRLHSSAPGSMYQESECGHDHFRSDWDAIRSFLTANGLVPAQPDGA